MHSDERRRLSPARHSLCLGLAANVEVSYAIILMKQGDGRMRVGFGTVSATMLALAGCSNAIPEQEASAVVAEKPTPSDGRVTAASTKVPLLGRCYMDECNWSIEKSRSSIRKSANGELFKLTLLGGASSHPDGDYDATRPIVWNKNSHVVYVFCSKKLPAAIMGTQVDVFNFPDIVPGALESGGRIYKNVCHASHLPDDEFAKKFGYGHPMRDSVVIEKPVDIFSAFDESSNSSGALAGADYENDENAVWDIKQVGRLTKRQSDAFFGDGADKCTIYDTDRRMVAITRYEAEGQEEAANMLMIYDGQERAMHSDGAVDPSGKFSADDLEGFRVTVKTGGLRATSDSGDVVRGSGTLSGEFGSIPITMSCLVL